MTFQDYFWVDSKVYCPEKDDKEDLSVFICNANNLFDKNNKDDFYYFCNRLNEYIKESEFNDMFKDYDDFMFSEIEIWKYYDLGYENKDILRMSNNCTFMLLFYKMDNQNKNKITNIVKEFSKIFFNNY